MATALKSRSAEADLHHIREQRVSEIAKTPVESARRLVAAEEALKAIERASVQAIHEYGITQERPEKWLTIGNLVLDLMAPVRDAARAGLKR